MRSALVRFLLSVACAVTLASGADAQDADWNKVVEAAKKEGKVVIYNSALGAPYFYAVLKAFEEKYGIKVDSLDLRASELTERIRTEQSSGRFLGDLEEHGSSTIERQIKENDFIRPHRGVPNAKNLRAPFTATDKQVPCFVQAHGILINTNLVKPEDEPKNWPDLLDPKWKGKILSDDTRPSGSGNTMFGVTYRKYGRAFHEKLAAQGLVFSRDLRQDARRVARGEYPIYIPQIFAFANDLKELPVKIVIPSDGSSYTQIDCAVLKNPPHPNAARVFINYFLEVESQVRYVNAWMIPVVHGVAERANPDARRFAEAPLLGNLAADEQEPMRKLASEIYK